jgi:hypothetical protein
MTKGKLLRNFPSTQLILCAISLIMVLMTNHKQLTSFYSSKIVKLMVLHIIVPR